MQATRSHSSDRRSRSQPCLHSQTRSRAQSRSRSCGWSLMELLVVLAILGLVATTVSVSMRGVWARFQSARALNNLLDLDDRARQLSVESGRGMELLLDPNGRVALQYQDGRELKRTTLGLPDGIELVCVSRGRNFRGGQGFRIPYSSAGTSPVLLLGLAGPAGTLNDTEQWVVVLAGGQRRNFANREPAERWLEAAE